ncbi:hypothetical protein F4809DRAFT_6124 [Biscogniauxia mediterranea]|nr:hypothetical protein F4809DRAFT_6124 [Biscogniauxia mediterranea]
MNVSLPTKNIYTRQTPSLRRPPSSPTRLTFYHFFSSPPSARFFLPSLYSWFNITSCICLSNPQARCLWYLHLILLTTTACTLTFSLIIPVRWSAELYTANNVDDTYSFFATTVTRFCEISHIRPIRLTRVRRKQPRVSAGNTSGHRSCWPDPSPK